MSTATARGTLLLSAEPLDLSDLTRTVVHPDDGAVASFIGVIRRHTDGHAVARLEYHAYASMARIVMADIAAEACAKHALGGVTIAHRVGTVEVGEPGMVVLTAAAHRGAALAACSWVVERLKQDLPVWKREHRATASVWLGGEHHG